METKELKITIPEGHEIDWQESAKQEKIVFKKKDTKPRSWKEYLDLNTGFDGCGINWSMDGGVQMTGLHHRGKAIVPTKYGAPFIAMMQLMSLRHDWIHRWSIDSGMTDDWEPDWGDFNKDKWGIIYYNNIFIIGILGNSAKSLSFPTKEMAEGFMKHFKDLLEISKSLI